jgi:hypothetical protein
VGLLEATAGNFTGCFNESFAKDTALLSSAVFGVAPAWQGGFENKHSAGVESTTGFRVSV